MKKAEQSINSKSVEQDNPVDSQTGEKELFVQIDEVPQDVDGHTVTDLRIELEDAEFSAVLNGIPVWIRPDIERLIGKGDKSAKEIHEIIDGMTNNPELYGEIDY